MLSFKESRVLAVLIEKLLTTPDQMPLSVNGCMLGCNQKTNREPVVNFTEAEVRVTLESLQSKGFALRCTGAGVRVEKFTQNLERALGLTREEITLLSILMLRGAQTPGELSTRSKRAWPEGRLEQIEMMLSDLAKRERPLVKRLERQPGQKESRWIELLSVGPDSGEKAIASHEEEVVLDERDEELYAMRDEIGFLRDEVAELRAMVQNLTLKLGDF